MLMLLVDWQLCAPSHFESWASVTALGRKRIKNWGANNLTGLKSWLIITLKGQLVGFTRLVKKLFE